MEFMHNSVFISIKHLHEIPTGSPPAGAVNACGYTAIVTIEGE